VFELIPAYLWAAIIAGFYIQLQLFSKTTYIGLYIFYTYILLLVFALIFLSTFQIKLTKNYLTELCKVNKE